MNLKAIVKTSWIEAGSPIWDYKATRQACLNANEYLRERQLDPAKRFREEIDNGNENYIQNWVLGCHFEWLNPR